MESQNKKMGILKAVGLVVLFFGIVAVTVFASGSTGNSLTPTEAWADVGKYLIMCLTVLIALFGVAKYILNGKIKPGCDKLFVDLDRRIKENDSKLGVFMMDMATRITGLEKQYQSLEKSVSNQTSNIAVLGETITKNYKEIVNMFLDSQK